MIAQARSLSAGNAVRLVFAPPPTASGWRVLRRTSNNFTGHDDPGAVLVHDGADDQVVDTDALDNGTAYYYAVWYQMGEAWVPGGIASATPAATYADEGIEFERFVVDRIDAGLKVEIAKGRLRPASGEVMVVTSPYALPDSATFPAVSVHMDTETPAERFIGDDVDGGGIGDDGEYTDGAGWLARTMLNVAGVSMNGEERGALRQALERVVRANLEVFAAAGLDQVEFSLRDTEEHQEHGSLYLTVGTFSCTRLVRTSSPVPAIRDVRVASNPYGQEPIP